MPMTAKGSEGATHELKDLEVFEVSLVDRPANKRPFLVVKNAEPNMPQGQELSTDENGDLTVTQKGGFSGARKKKIKGALASAAKKLSSMVEAIDAAEDEASFLKQVSAVASSLGGMGSAPADDKGDKGEKGDAKKDDDAEGNETPVESDTAPDFRSEQLDSMEADLQSALKDSEPDPEPSAAEKANAKKLAELEGEISTLTKATHTLTRVVKTTSNGARPASQAAPTGENPTVQKSASDVWKLDMNSTDPDPDEQFI